MGPIQALLTLQDLWKLFHQRLGFFRTFIQETEDGAQNARSRNRNGRLTTANRLASITATIPGAQKTAKQVYIESPHNTPWVLIHIFYIPNYPKPSCMIKLSKVLAVSIFTLLWGWGTPLTNLISRVEKPVTYVIYIYILIYIDIWVYQRW